MGFLLEGDGQVGPRGLESSIVCMSQPMTAHTSLVCSRNRPFRCARTGLAVRILLQMLHASRERRSVRSFC